MTWDIGTLNGKGLEICEELWKRNVDLRCLQQARWLVRGPRLIGLQGRRYKLCQSGNQEKNGGVSVLVKEGLYDKVDKVRRVNDRVISLAIVFEEVVRIICACASQSGSSTEEKETYEDLSREWTTHK